MAALLTGIVGVSATLGLQFATQRQAAARAQQQVVSWVHEELSSLQSQALLGTLSSSLDTTVTRNLSALRSVTLRTQTSASAEATNVVNITVTATFFDTATRVISVRSAAFNSRLARMISVKLVASSVATLSTSRFYGYYPAPNWNRMTTASAATNTLRDRQGTLTTMTVTTSLSSFQDFTTNLVTTGASACGENLEGVFRGGNWNGASTPSTYTLTLGSVPYSRYDVIFYVNVPNTGSGSDGYIQLSGGATQNTLFPTSATDTPRQDFVVGRNTVIFSGLSSAGPVFTIGATTNAPPLHGFQVVERL